MIRAEVEFLFDPRFPHEPKEVAVMTELQSSTDTSDWKALFNGQAVKAELLMLMLEKHDLESCARWENGDVIPEDSFDDEPMDRIATVYVRSTDYDHAWTLFYADREDEI